MNNIESEIKQQEATPRVLFRTTNDNKTESTFQFHCLLLSLSCSPCPSILFWGNNQYNCRQFHASQTFGEGEMEEDGEERERGPLLYVKQKELPNQDKTTQVMSD